MKLAATTYGVLTALVFAGIAAAQTGEKRTIKERTMILIDANTKGISEQTDTNGTGIKEIQLKNGRLGTRTFQDANYANGKVAKGVISREWVVKSAIVGLEEGAMMETQILLLKDIGETTLQNVRNGGPSFLSDRGTGRWYVFLAEYDVAADMSAENNARAKKDREALQGTWRRDAVMKIVVDGDKLTRYDSRPGQEEALTGTFNLDPKSKAFDWTGKLGPGLHVYTKIGIYDLKSDVLKIYFGSELGRAKTFDEKGGELWIFIREEK